MGSGVSHICRPRPEERCSRSGGEPRLLLPIFRHEDHWDVCTRGFCYTLGLIYFFVGVAIISDIFMASIETIVSRTKPVLMDWGDGLNKMTYHLRVSVWNGTIANLTLMALGSSAPEILLSVIEICSNRFESGELGPGTIVGSAAFNLLVITAVCVYYVPKGETRKIEIYRVFVVTTIFSLFAYLWMIIVLNVITPDVVDLWEALVTLLCFPLMVGISWWADNEFFLSCKKRKMRQSIYDQLVDLRKMHEAMERGGKKPAENELQLYSADGQLNSQALIAYYKKIKAVAEVSDEEAASLLAMKLVDSRQHNRLWYRTGAVRTLMGGGKLTPVLNEKLKEVYAVLNKMQIRESGDPTKFHMGMGQDHKPPETFKKKAIIEFEAASIAVPENIGFITIPIVRKGREDNEVAVNVHTIEGTAKNNTDFEPLNVELIFEPFVFEQSVSVRIVDDDQWEPEEFFYVRLSIVDPVKHDAITGRTNTVEITILDDDRPGILTFTQRAMLVIDTANEAEITIERQEGCDGIISCKYRTFPDLNSPLKHPNALEGEITFQSGERSKCISIPLMDAGTTVEKETFVVDLFDPEGGTTLGVIHSIKVTISRDENFQLEVSKVVERTNSVISNIEIATNITYRQQIKSAFLVNGGSTEAATKKDYFFHFITIFWKVLFSFIPPPHWCGGWLCFFFSLAAIGVLTAFIGDMAGIFGCVIGLKDTITAITFVALGTSLPDTFASVAAAIHDKNADNAIGNVTGSNSVNVFLGLGIPWTIAAIYHQFYKKDRFRVKSGSLVFSVVIYSIVAVIAIAILVMRRFLVVWGQAELGGPRATKLTTMLTFIALWLIYVAMSSIRAYHPEVFENMTALL